MKESEIIFVVQETPQGGYEARAVRHPIFTEAESLDELRKMVRDAVSCHFDPAKVPAEIRLHFVRSENVDGKGLATIGRSLVVKGELSGSEDMIVDGEVEGSITMPGRTLTIGPNARLRANIEARNVILHGRLNGDVRASDRVEVRKSASVCGSISTARISIEDGAYFKGAIDIQKIGFSSKIEAQLETTDEVITA